MNKLFDIAIIGHGNVALDLAKSFSKDIEVAVIYEALFLNYKNGLFITTAGDKDTICSKSIIIAQDPAQIKNYPEFISINDYKDINKIADKTVFVKGAGEAGTKFALWAEKIAKKVYICDKEISPTCKKVLANELLTNPNITFLSNCTINDYKVLDNKLKAVILNTYSEIDCDYIFEAIGVKPETEIFKQFVELNDDGYIKIDNDMASKLVPGVFAIGESTTKKFNDYNKNTLIENIKKFIKK